MNMLGHISNTLSNHPTPFPFEDTNYDYTIYGVLSKIEKMLLGGFDLETIRKKEKRGYWVLLMKHTNEPLLIQEILMSLYLELLDDYTIYGILEKKKMQ